MTIIPLFAAAEVATHSTNPVITIVLGILGVIGVIGIIGAASAYFYKGRADALISLQEKEIIVLRDNNKMLTEQNELLKLESLENKAEMKRMRTEMKTLRSLVTQPKQYQKLATTMAEHHAQVLNKLTDIAAGLVNTAMEQQNHGK